MVAAGVLAGDFLAPAVPFFFVAAAAAGCFMGALLATGATFFLGAAGDAECFAALFTGADCA